MARSDSGLSRLGETLPNNAIVSEELGREVTIGKYFVQRPMDKRTPLHPVLFLAIGLEPHYRAENQPSADDSQPQAWALELLTSISFSC